MLREDGTLTDETGRDDWRGDRRGGLGPGDAGTLEEQGQPAVSKTPQRKDLELFSIFFETVAWIPGS